jgi:hypothetical protein
VLAAADATASAKRMTVADLGPVIDAKERMEAHRWKPRQAEIDRVMLDLLGGNHPRRRHIPYVKPAQLKEGKQNGTAKSSGLSRSVIKRMMRSRDLPSAAR